MDQLAGLSQDARKLAFDRFRLLQPHLEDDRPLKAVATAARVPFRTAQRWVSLYRQFGLAGLARKKRTDNGRRHAISAKLKEVIEGLALQKPPLPVASICRQVRRLAQDLGEEPPSYWVVYRIVAALPVDLVTLAHEGTKAYSNTFELIHRREADRANAVWQADHTPLDILLIRPDGAAAKPWLTTRERSMRVRNSVRDPTALLIIDEADRLKVSGLEQVRDIFDRGGIGLVLIGMPGLEKKLARYPQFYSRIGFVHEFRPLGVAEVRRLLEQHWAPAGVKLPPTPPDQETVAVIIRVTGGNFRLLNRLLTQIERILEINALAEITKAVVEAARESLVIGQV